MSSVNASAPQLRQQDLQILPWQARGRASHGDSSRSRSRSPRRTYIPRNSWWSNVAPTSPRPAQHLSGDQHGPQMIMSALCLHLHWQQLQMSSLISMSVCPQRPTTTPSDAVLWQDVEIVWYPPMHYVTVLRYSDLRHIRWEMC